MNKMIKENLGCSIIVMIIGVLLLIGEVRCIYQFVTSDFKAPYKREVLYGISAVTGIGSIVGWFNISDDED